MKYVDVILPLPLDGTFTYSVPDGMEGKVVPGVRLLVPLGKSKKYIAMATRLHDDKPAFSCKPVEAVLDNTPSLLPQQMRLWQWIGYYYMAPLGDVYNAAMPGGLKSTEKFKPKMELYVELASTYRSEQALHVALNLVQRALKQAKTLTTFLSLSHWDSLDGDTPREGIKKVTKEELMNAFHEKLKDYLRQYYYVGGMPEVVKTYIENRLPNQVRTIQNEILSNYANDFSKHAPTQEVPRIDMVWQSILSQLSKENKKFVYGVLKKGGRAKEFELAIQWLVDAGLVYKIIKVTKPELPLKFYEDLSAFKLYLCDCGLMGAMADTAAKDVLLGDNVFMEYKGAFTENYVLQQLKSVPRTFVYYYSNENSTMEIDFVVQHDNEVIPVEVKAEENLRAKSLRQFITDNPGLHGLRFSMSGYREQEWMTNVPLWAVKWSFG